MRRTRGFTLLELLIYVGILAMSAALLTGILATTLKVQNRESASNEVTSQLNFVMQNISRLTRESSHIEIATSTATSTLKLRMKDSAKDPTCLSLVNGVIKLAEGPDPSNKQNCVALTSDLTSDRVVVDTLNFTRYTQFPGHDTVSVDIQMTYNSQNLQQRATRNLRSAIARVSAATFDAGLFPGIANTYDIGLSGTSWKNLYLAGDAFISGNVGIGTTGPEDKLTVYGGVPGVTNIRLLNLNTAGSQQDIAFGLVDDRGVGRIDLTFSTEYSSGAWSERMRLTNEGNVGIATTTPGSPLTVAGEIYSSTGGFKFPDGSTQTAAATSGTFPSFSVHKNGTDQGGLLNSTYTLVTWSTEDWDTNNNFASNKFTPTIAGRYLLIANIGWVEGGGKFRDAIYKNGSLYLYSEDYYPTTIPFSQTFSVIVYANGTTDYFEVYAWESVGGGNTIKGATTMTRFMGHRLP